MAELWNYRRAILVMLGLYWLSLVVATHYPLESVPVLFTNQDKAVHIFAYGIFTALLWWAIQLGPWRTVRFMGILVVFGLAVHAAMDEYTQQYFRGRFPDFFDYCADMLGVLIAIPIADWTFRRVCRPRRHGLYSDPT